MTNGLRIGGARRDRTADLLRARQALSQLSYGPFLLVFFAICGVALFARSVMYISTLPRSLLRAPCISQKILRKNTVANKETEFRANRGAVMRSLVVF